LGKCLQATHKELRKVRSAPESHGEGVLRMTEFSLSFVDMLKVAMPHE